MAGKGHRDMEYLSKIVALVVEQERTCTPAAALVARP
jgi:hypothetical protein